MTTVRDIMTTPVVVVDADAAIGQIAAVLHQHRISAVPVVDDDGDVVGLVSEYDLLARPAGPTAREVMTTAVLSVTEDTDVDDVRHLLIDRRIRRVPVLSGGKLVGIISRADIVALAITEWVCPVCGESVRGEQPPASCPKCRGTDDFVSQVQPPGP
jgi:CBS domain-containing protein